jgi:hypothetical protein
MTGKALMNIWFTTKGGRTRMYLFFNLSLLFFRIAALFLQYSQMKLFKYTILDQFNVLQVFSASVLRLLCFAVLAAFGERMRRFSLAVRHG